MWVMELSALKIPIKFRLPPDLDNETGSTFTGNRCGRCEGPDSSCGGGSEQGLVGCGSNSDNHIPVQGPRNSHPDGYLSS